MGSVCNEQMRSRTVLNDIIILLSACDCTNALSNDDALNGRISTPFSNIEISVPLFIKAWY